MLNESLYLSSLKILSTHFIFYKLFLMKGNLKKLKKTDFKQIVNNTAGVRSLSKVELVFEIEKKFSD